MVDMIPVNSSNVKEVGYDAKNSELHVSFHSSGTYVYDGVPVDEYEALVTAESVGKHFNKYIKNGAYKPRVEAAKVPEHFSDQAEK